MTSSSTLATRAPRRHRRRLLATALAAAALGAGALGAAPAGAAVVPVGSTPIPTPTTPRPCSWQLYGCPIDTVVSFAQNGDAIHVYATFPSGSTGWVHYKLACADGFTKSATVAIAANVYRQLADYGEHKVLQTCSVTQTLSSVYTTSWATPPPDPDELWSVKNVVFTNTKS